MKIFLDVGAHTGETLETVVPLGLFDHIYSFEPVSACVSKLKRLKGAGVTILPFGLAGKTKKATIHNAGTLGASMYSDSEWTTENKLDLCPYGSTEECEFVRASDWFRNWITEGDFVIMKLNCEGAECDILWDLIVEDEIKKVSFLNVAWDIELFPGQEHRRKEIEKALKIMKVKFIKSDLVYEPPFDFSPYLPHAAYTAYWLKLAMLCTQHDGPRAGWGRKE